MTLQEFLDIEEIKQGYENLQDEQECFVCDECGETMPISVRIPRNGYDLCESCFMDILYGVYEREQ